MAVWNPDILNFWVAPGQADLVVVDIPDLTSEFPTIEEIAPYHILQSVMFKRYNEQFRFKVLNFLYRNYAAFQFYHEARAKSVEFTLGRIPGEPRISLYMDSVRLWEACIHNLRIAMEIWSAKFGEKHFVKGSGTVEERIWELCNDIKHDVEGLASGTLWIETSGLRTRNWKISFEELAGEIRALAIAARIAAFPDAGVDA